MPNLTMCLWQCYQNAAFWQSGGLANRDGGSAAARLQSLSAIFFSFR